MSYSTANTARIKDIVGKLIKTHFSSTLGREQDIVNLVAAQIYLESRYVNRTGTEVGYAKGTTGYSYINSSAVKSKLDAATPDERKNIFSGLQAMGLMQVMGWNLVKGGSTTGKCEVERLRPDLVPTLCVDPGAAIIPFITGPGNEEKALLAGLVILEGKYRAVYRDASGFGVRGDRYNRRFSSKMAAAFAAYLGLGKSDLNGMSPETYALRIVGGDIYQKVNFGTSSIGQSSSVRVISSNGPSTNGSNLDAIKPVGC